jgi:hypothetical protein
VHRAARAAGSNALERCSFCGKHKDQVERLIQGGQQPHAPSLPIVFICDECIKLCARIIGYVNPDPVPPAQKLTNWARVDIDGETYRWSAVRETITTEAFGKPTRQERVMMILVGKIAEPAVCMMHPEETQPTEALAIEAVRRLLLNQ